MAKTATRKPRKKSENQIIREAVDRLLRAIEEHKQIRSDVVPQNRNQGLVR